MIGVRGLLAAGMFCALLLLAAPATPAETGTLSIDVRDVDIGDAIEMLAAQAGINVMTDASVKPERVTIRLSGVSFDEALHAIVTAHGLRVRSENGILIVSAAESRDRVSGDAAASTSAPVEAETRSYRLRFLRASDAVAKLKATISGGNFLADDEQNAVLATGDARLQASTRSLLGNVDRPSAQVLFEVKVADVTPVNDASNVGLEFGGLDLQGQPLPGGVAYNFVSGTIPINVTLNAMVSKGRASILATPKLVTINNKEADLSIGETYPIVYSTSVFGGQNVQYVDIGVHLRLTPTIGVDGSVTAELHPEYSELVGFTPTGYPIVANRKIDSTLRVQDDQTIVLGGLIRDTANQTISKIPGLSDIPLIGKLFQNKQAAHERDEIVFLITPHVIYPGNPPPQK